MKNGFLCIGHCCHDKVQDGYILGGTSSYSAMIAKAWNKDVSILTSVGDDFAFHDEFTSRDISMYNVPATRTTCFQNIYQNGNRTQYLLARANTLVEKDIPKLVQETPVVLFGLIADEVDQTLLASFPNSLKGASIQGFLRAWDDKGLITPKSMDWSLLTNIDIVILSDEDIAGVSHYIENIKAHCHQVVLTHGSKGATVYLNHKEYFFPSYPTSEVDPTGAGDVFTTAYILEYHKTNDIRKACIFAHCAASFIIEAQGISNLPTLDQVYERMAGYESQLNKK